jgi:tetratricopeptide (TPR) repeat protein
MKPLQPPDSFHVLAASGWLDLGNSAEANLELEKIAPEWQHHPHVLQTRWLVSADQKDWEKALAAAADLVRTEPDEPLGWVHQSYALHELKRTREALDQLLGVIDKFPTNATMRYNLACYECQLGNLPQARTWLEHAYRLGERSEMQAMALQDPDLKPLWGEIKGKSTS